MRQRRRSGPSSIQKGAAPHCKDSLVVGTVLLVPCVCAVLASPCVPIAHRPTQVPRSAPRRDWQKNCRKRSRCRLPVRHVPSTGSCRCRRSPKSAACGRGPRSLLLTPETVSLLVQLCRLVNGGVGSDFVYPARCRRAGRSGPKQRAVLPKRSSAKRARAARERLLCRLDVSSNKLKRCMDSCVVLRHRHGREQDMARCRALSRLLIVLGMRAEPICALRAIRCALGRPPRAVAQE